MSDVDSKRRNFLRGLMSVAGVATASTAYAQHEHAPAPSKDPVRTPPPAAPVPPDKLGPGVVPVVTPDVPDMPWRLEDGVKVFEIAAEHVRTEFVPGRTVDAWGFNGSVPGPTIQVNDGDRVRLIVENRLPEGFSMHWHGLEIPNEMDGMPGISQDLIAPGAKFVYEFTLHQNGTFFYHSHMAMQEMMGLIGMFVIHPKRAHTPRVDRDYAIVLQEWAILPNNTIPNTLAMEFNWLTFNGKAGPATTPLLCKVGERVRIRLVNLGMDHHPIHLHGHQFFVTGSEGGRIRTTAEEPANTVLVGVAQARDIEFVANNPGDWHFHCHLPHHMMNQMVSMVGPMMSGAGNSQPTFLQPTRSTPGQEMFPGYPQDMFMVVDETLPEGAEPEAARAGIMTARVGKPETYGLRPGWSGATMGMMTIVRVLQPELFDKIAELKAQQERKARG